jgi:predicted unusual protein kinase regulating ubiquinone biosynthesis (AarF/ABC1/UbiB family)
MVAASHPSDFLHELQMNLHRLLRMRRGTTPTDAAPMSGESDVIRPMSRRTVSHSISSAHVNLPMARRVRFEPGVFLPIARLFLWLWCLMRFYSGNLVDLLLRRASVERRAVRLRRVFEETGPTFQKLGQQLSMRADLLPYAYCAELVKMLDQAPGFPTDQAIAIIERNLGKPLGDVFETFDPEPIGSASLACVYQAQLRTGERVAVKVRRPGIGPLIAADLRAMDWLLIVAETLTLIPPGSTRRFREDFQTILFNELNFRAEARYTDLFRRRAAKQKKGVTAPRVYFEHCTEEVMVSEFVSGVWMWELMAAVDSNDQEFLSKVRRIGIEPKSLARKLIMIMDREVNEELFFHADPHPANLVVMPNNGICFIDFGAVGRFSTKTRKILRELQHHMIRGDIGRLVNCALSLSGPLPPMDVERVRTEMEKVYADAVFATHSRDAEWWEKSSAQGWLRLLEIARRFAIPANFEAIQLYRTSFAYDAILVRLDKDIDVIRAWKACTREAAKEARQRVQKSMRQRLRGPTDTDYMAMEQFGDMVTQFVFQLQRNIEDPIIHFRNIVGKIAYIASLMLKLGYLVAAAVGIGLVTDGISRHWFGLEIDWASILEQATTFGWIQLALIAIILVIIRRIVIRLNLPDTRLNPDR